MCPFCVYMSKISKMTDTKVTFLLLCYGIDFALFKRCCSFFMIVHSKDSPSPLSPFVLLLVYSEDKHIHKNENVDFSKIKKLIRKKKIKSNEKVYYQCCLVTYVGYNLFLLKI